MCEFFLGRVGQLVFSVVGCLFGYLPGDGHKLAAS